MLELFGTVSIFLCNNHNIVIANEGLYNRFGPDNFTTVIVITKFDFFQCCVWMEIFWSKTLYIIVAWFKNNDEQTWLYYNFWCKLQENVTNERSFEQLDRWFCPVWQIYQLLFTQGFFTLQCGMGVLKMVSIDLYVPS